MANEIQVTSTLTASYGGTTVTGSVTKTITLASPYTLFSQTQNVGTTTEAIEVPADTSWIWLKNTDSTNFVLIDYVSPAAVMKLKAGESMIMRPADNTAPVIYAKADTSAINLQIVAVGSD